MTADLAAWLVADDGPIADDERVANAALARTRRWPKGDAPWENAALQASIDPGPAGVLARMAAFGDPARVLGECAAKRQVIAECLDRLLSSDAENFPDDLAPDLAGRILRALAQPYAGRPGWREEWRA